MSSFLTPYVRALLLWQFALAPLFIFHLVASVRGTGVRVSWSLQRILLVAIFVLPLVPGEFLTVTPEVHPALSLVQRWRAVEPHHGELPNLTSTAPGDNSIAPRTLSKRRQAVSWGLMLSGLICFLYRQCRWLRHKKRLMARARPLRALKNVKVFESAEAGGPFITGVLSPIIFLPPSVAAVPRVRKTVLRHELIHLQQGHLIWSGLEGLIRHCFWFLPGTHILFATGSRLREYICDRRSVVKSSRKAYLDALWFVASSGKRATPLGGAAWGGVRELGRRIRLLGKRRPRRGVLIAGGVSALLLTVGLSGIQQVAAAPVTPPAQTRESAEIPASESPDYWPLGNRRGIITLAFGTQTHPVRQRPFFHQGVDIYDSAHERAIVFSVGSGEVEQTGSDPEGRGLFVVVSHPGGWRSMYAHLSRVTVEEGSRVEAGTPLGTIGATGIALGPHLHFELRQDDVAVNPLDYLDRPAR